MGNCQAAEAAATVVIEHPGGNKVEMIYWSVSANEMMNSNPGHYVAQVLLPAKQLKLLRPDDTLLIGQLYRLISFQDVLKEFGAKKCVRFLREGESSSIKQQEEVHDLLSGGGNNGGSSSGRRGVGRPHHGGGGQWRPALQSIQELGS